MIADGLREFIESNQYDYADLGNGCFRLRFSGKNGDYNMFAQASQEPCHVTVFTYCPVKMPEDRHAQVADYLNRVKLWPGPRLHRNGSRRRPGSVSLERACRTR